MIKAHEQEAVTCISSCKGFYFFFFSFCLQLLRSKFRVTPGPPSECPNTSSSHWFRERPWHGNRCLLSAIVWFPSLAVQAALRREREPCPCCSPRGRTRIHAEVGSREGATRELDLLASPSGSVRACGKGVCLAMSAVVELTWHWGTVWRVTQWGWRVGGGGRQKWEQEQRRRSLRPLLWMCWVRGGCRGNILPAWSLCAPHRWEFQQEGQQLICHGRVLHPYFHWCPQQHGAFLATHWEIFYMTSYSNFGDLESLNYQNTAVLRNKCRLLIQHRDLWHPQPFLLHFIRSGVHSPPINADMLDGCFVRKGREEIGCV